MVSSFQGFHEEHIQNSSCRRLNKYWQIPIHLVEVAFPTKFYNIQGRRLSIGEPIYPVTRRYLTFSWEPPQNRIFPDLIKEFDQGDQTKLLDLESVLTSFAYGNSFDSSEADSDKLLVVKNLELDLACFGRFFNHYYNRYDGSTISAPETKWDLSIFDTAAELLIMATSPRFDKPDEYGNNRREQNRINLVSLTNMCRQKTGHWLRELPAAVALQP
jgi:hypothetical protein